MTETRLSPITLTTADGTQIAAQQFFPEGAAQAAIVVGPAMGVPAGYYKHFAAWLAMQGYHVTTFDYRGFGASLALQGGDVRRVKTDTMTWAREDYQAAIDHARHSNPKMRLLLLGSSLGGQLPGFLPRLEGIDGLLAIGTGSGYWRICAPGIKWRSPLLMYFIGPIAMALAGYFPGRKLGIFDDIPKGAMQQWVGWCRDPEYCIGVEPGARESFARVTFPVHYLSFTDDEFMTRESTEAMLNCYTAAPRQHTRVAPADWGLKRIGHLGLFRKEMAVHWSNLIPLLTPLFTPFKLEPQPS